jgi:hypothetical protein
VYSITIKGVAQVPYAKPVAAGGAMAKGGPVPVEVFADPIEIVVIPTALAKVTAGPIPNNILKLGTTTEIPIKVERLHEFAGEFKVKFVPDAASAAAGVTAVEVTIPAGKDEIKLALVTAKEAKAGPVNGLIVVTGTYAGKHAIANENKVGFTVAK